jgi:hypothetical protein
MQALENSFPWNLGLLLLMDLWPIYSVIICPAGKLVLLYIPMMWIGNPRVIMVMLSDSVFDFPVTCTICCYCKSPDFIMFILLFNG